MFVRFQYWDELTIERPFKFLKRSELEDWDFEETGNDVGAKCAFLLYGIEITGDGWIRLVSVLLFWLVIEVESDELTLLLLLLWTDYLLESIAFFALDLYLVTDKGVGFIGFLALEVEGVEGIDRFEEEIDEVDGTDDDIDVVEGDFFGTRKGPLISGSFSNFQSS